MLIVSIKNRRKDIQIFAAVSQLLLSDKTRIAQ